MTTSLTPAERYAFESIVIAELDAAAEPPRVIRPVQPTVARYVRRSPIRRIATSQFAADLRPAGVVVGAGLAAVIALAGQIAGAW